MYIKIYIKYFFGGFLKLGNNLRKFRFEHNEISQQELANNVGVSRLTIHSVETGKFIPSTLLSLKIAHFFNAAVEDIFYLNEEGENK